MFDVSFSELMIIALVALVFIGPEKLPKVARTLGALMGRMQRYVAQVKEEVNREARFADLQKLQTEIQQGWDQAEENFKTHVAEMEQTIQAPALTKPEATSQAKPKAVRAKKNTPKTAPTKHPKTKIAAKKRVADADPAKNVAVEKVAAKKTPVKKVLIKKVVAQKLASKKAVASQKA